MDGLQAAPPAWNPPRGPLPDLDEGLLLELRGSALQPLLQGLVSRELIRAPLSERYGLDHQRLERLERAPFRLRLRPMQQGRFLAGMELQLSLEGRPDDWQPVLRRISDTLAAQEFKSGAGANATLPSGAPVTAPSDTKAPSGTKDPSKIGRAHV